MEYIYFYIAIGFVLNTALALITYYRGSKEGYVLIPHAMIYYLTIFSWPKTLFDMIATTNGKDDDEGRTD